MNRSINLQNLLPDDIALKIASSLQVFDLCSLASVSRFWRELCGSDCVWEALYRERWPAIVLGEDSESQPYELDQETRSNLKGWRDLYISKHNEMAGKAGLVISFVERALAFESMEVGNYSKAIALLNSQHFRFGDIKMFLLKPHLSVLLNLVALDYCIVWLLVPAQCIIEAVDSCGISERQVCVQWWKLGRWFYGFRLRDEVHSRTVSLGDLAAYNEEILAVLHRGAIHEVIRVQISAVKPTQTSWSVQVAQTVNI